MSNCKKKWVPGAADPGEFPNKVMTLSVNNLGSSRQIMSEEGPSDLAEDSQLEDERLESEELER